MSELNPTPRTGNEGRAAISISLRELEPKFSSWATMVPSNPVNRYRPPLQDFVIPLKISQHACRQVDQPTAPRRSKTSSKDTVPFPSRTELLVSAKKGGIAGHFLSSLRFSEAFRVLINSHWSPPFKVSVWAETFFCFWWSPHESHSTRLLRRTGPA